VTLNHEIDGIDGCERSRGASAYAQRGRKHVYLHEPADPLSAIWAKLCMERREGASGA
jgi:hypothetical protein